MFIHYFGFYTALNLSWKNDGRLAETKRCATCGVDVDKGLVLRHGYFSKCTSKYAYVRLDHPPCHSQVFCGFLSTGGDGYILSERCKASIGLRYGETFQIRPWKR